MQTLPLIIIFGSAILIWQVILTYFFVRMMKEFKLLLKGTKVLNFDLKKNIITDINNKLSVLEREELKHIQKIGFVRFNPFNETGGDNSFTLSLLDANSDGIILTGLHTREKTRIYAKKIEKGKSRYELSKEEIKALKEAI